jgi:hypothetical protein
MKRLFTGMLLLTIAGLAQAQDATLIDLLQTKGVLTKKEVQKLKKDKGTQATYDQQALIKLLRSKGVLEDKDLAQLQTPVTPAAPAVAAVPEINERLSRVESQQQALQAQTQAQAEQQAKAVDDFKRTAVADVKKDIDWLNRFTLFGDVRNRVEGFYQKGEPARTRERFRLRFGATLKISDELIAGLRLASGDPNDPISQMQTMGSGFTRKPINIDWAYFTLMPKKSIGLGDLTWNPIVITVGKFQNPAFKPRAAMPSELVWDEDLAPEGASETFTPYEASEGLVRRAQFNLMQWVVTENPQSHGDGAWMFGGQGIVTLQLHPRARLTLAMADYGYMKANFMARLRNSNSQLKLTNTAVLNNGTIVPGGFPISPGSTTATQIKNYFGDFNILNGAFQLDVDTGYADWPLTLIGDFANNTESKTGKDFAVWTGFSLGRTLNPGDFAFSAAWVHMETDSVVSFFSFSDYGRNGGTNQQGPTMRIDYVLYPRLVFSVRDTITSYIDRPKGQSNSTLNRLQFDATLSF